MTENEFIHIVPQLRQITLQISQGYGVGCDEAEDIAQDAMLKLWAIKDDIQSAAHAKGSMGCIAKHLCIDFFRKRKMISIEPSLSISRLATMRRPMWKWKTRRTSCGCKNASRLCPPTNIRCFICDR